MLNKACLMSPGLEQITVTETTISGADLGGHQARAPYAEILDPPLNIIIFAAPRRAITVKPSDPPRR